MRKETMEDEDTLYKYDPIYDIFYPVDFDDELRKRIQHE